MDDLHSLGAVRAHVDEVRDAKNHRGRNRKRTVDSAAAAGAPLPSGLLPDLISISHSPPYRVILGLHTANQALTKAYGPRARLELLSFLRRD